MLANSAASMENLGLHPWGGCMSKKLDHGLEAVLAANLITTLTSLFPANFGCPIGQNNH